MKNNLHKAFTLVELIVVITILSVLSAIAFISFQGYASSSRDSVRLSEIKNISKAFEITRTRWDVFPMPDNYTKITYSGSTLQYQGQLTDSVLNKLGIFDWWEDPKSNLPYTVSINEQKNKFQILGFFENTESLALQSKVYADNSSLFYKLFWDDLGIFMQLDTNIPIISLDNTNVIDISTTKTPFRVAIDNDLLLVWDSDKLTSLLTLNKSFSSCKEILNWFSNLDDGYYFLQNNNIKEKVYCDMSTNQWWWTAIANISKWWNIWWVEDTWENNQTFWNTTKYNQQDYKNFYYQSIWNDIMYVADNWAKVFFNECLNNKNLPEIFSQTLWKSIDNWNGVYYWFRCEMSGGIQSGLGNYLNFKVYDESQWASHGKSMLSSVATPGWMVFWYSWIWIIYTSRHDSPTNIIETSNWDGQYSTDFWHSSRNINNVTLFIR